MHKEERELQVLKEQLKALKDKSELTPEEAALKDELTRKIEESELTLETQRVERFLELAEKANRFDITTVEGQEILRMREFMSRLYFNGERFRTLVREARSRPLSQVEAAELAELKKHQAYVRMADYIEESIKSLPKDGDA